MGATVPAVRAASPVRLSSTRGQLLALVPMATFVLAASLVTRELVTGTAMGLFCFVIYRLVVVRELVCRDHRRGMTLTKAGELEKAIGAFRASEATWRRRAWLDRSRAITLASTGPWPYLSLARYNQAYCQARLGRADEATATLDALLRDQPGMALARELRDALQAGAVAGPPPAGDPTWGGLVDEMPGRPG